MMSAAWTWSGDWKKRSMDVFRILWFFTAPLLIVLLLTASPPSRAWTIGEKVAAYLALLLITLLRDVIYSTIADKRPDLLEDDGPLALMLPHLAFWLGLFATAWLFHYLLLL